MTYFNYAILSGFSKHELLEIDQKVVENRKILFDSVKNVPLAVKSKSNELFVLVILGVIIIPRGINTIPLPLPIIPMVKAESTLNLSNSTLGLKKTFKNFESLGEGINEKVNKVRVNNGKMKQFYTLAIAVNTGHLSMEEAILSLRAGDGFTDIICIILFIIAINWYESTLGVESFQVKPYQDPLGWRNNNYQNHPKNVQHSGSYPVLRPSTHLELEKPTLMPQNEYDQLRKSEKRQLADPKGRDRVVQMDGRPRLDIRYNQVEHKLGKHGKEFGLPTNAKDKTPKTEANALALRDAIVSMANEEEIVWYTNGQYQGGTPRSYDTINLFDKKRKIITVYEKKDNGCNLFLTTCTLTQTEVDHLESSNGNFLTESMIKQQTAISTNVIDSTNSTNTINTINTISIISIISIINNTNVINNTNDV